MIKKLLSVLIAILAFTLPCVGQDLPELQIVASNNAAVVSWSNAPQLSVLQATTNLSRPISWSNVSDAGFATNFTASNASPQQFFRIAQVMPLFQFAIFYNVNMEIDPGRPMVIKEPVFCNASIWACASALTFLSSVDAVGTITTNTPDPFSDGYADPGSATFDVPYLTNQPSLSMPITGTNTSAASVQNILNLPPAGSGLPNRAALQSSNQVYIYNTADLIISNSATGINGSSTYGSNITVYYENSNVIGYLQLVTNDMVSINTSVTPHTTNEFYSFVTNVTFYDFRESKTVQAVQIDVAKFNAWLITNTASGGENWNFENTFGPTSKGHNLDSIYVYNNVPLTTAQLPAVRIINGQQLPSSFGLTIATPQPLYVLGNYNVQTNGGSPVLGTTNTASTYPAALMGDAITILSGNWRDSVDNENPTPNATTINAATLEGIVPSDPTISGSYSGGVENFLRLLENWAGVTLTYNGSIAVMFDSQYATNHWGGSYYGVPARNWNFDSNFLNLNKLPPLTPSVVNFVTP